MLRQHLLFTFLKRRSLHIVGGNYQTIHPAHEYSLITGIFKMTFWISPTTLNLWATLGYPFKFSNPITQIPFTNLVAVYVFRLDLAFKNISMGVGTCCCSIFRNRLQDLSKYSPGHVRSIVLDGWGDTPWNGVGQPLQIIAWDCSFHTIHYKNPQG